MVAPHRNVHGAELADLVTTLTTLVGAITALNVNWPPGRLPPDYNRPGWPYHRPHIITVTREQDHLRLLVVARAILTAVDSLLDHDHGDVDDATWAQLTQHLNDHQLIEGACWPVTTTAWRPRSQH
ncbi:DUF5994 family protein [Mycobacterium sp. LTG2003]